MILTEVLENNNNIREKHKNELQTQKNVVEIFEGFFDILQAKKQKEAKNPQENGEQIDESGLKLSNFVQVFEDSEFNSNDKGEKSLKNFELENNINYTLSQIVNTNVKEEQIQNINNVSKNGNEQNEELTHPKHDNIFTNLANEKATKFVLHSKHTQLSKDLKIENESVLNKNLIFTYSEKIDENIEEKIENKENKKSESILKKFSQSGNLTQQVSKNEISPNTNKIPTAFLENIKDEEKLLQTSNRAKENINNNKKELNANIEQKYTKLVNNNIILSKTTQIGEQEFNIKKVENKKDGNESQINGTEKKYIKQNNNINTITLLNSQENINISNSKVNFENKNIFEANKNEQEQTVSKISANNNSNSSQNFFSGNKKDGNNSELQNKVLNFQPIVLNADANDKSILLQKVKTREHTTFKTFNEVELEMLPKITAKIARTTSEGNISQARFNLNPKILGTVFVELTVNNNMVSINFTTQKQEAVKLIEKSLAQLSDLLKSQGLNTENVQIRSQDTNFFEKLTDNNKQGRTFDEQSNQKHKNAAPQLNKYKRFLADLEDSTDFTFNYKGHGSLLEQYI